MNISFHNNNNATNNLNLDLNLSMYFKILAKSPETSPKIEDFKSRKCNEKNGGSKLCSRDHWKPAEDAQLKQLVLLYGPQNWNLIAEKLGARSGKSCRLRWFNQLDPQITKRPFTEEEEERLKSAHRVYGNKWALIARLFPGRTDNAIKNHFHVMEARQDREKSCIYTKKRNFSDKHFSNMAGASKRLKRRYVEETRVSNKNEDENENENRKKKKDNSSESGSSTCTTELSLSNTSVCQQQHYQTPLSHSDRDKSIFVESLWKPATNVSNATSYINVSDETVGMFNQKMEVQDFSSKVSTEFGVFTSIKYSKIENGYFKNVSFIDFLG